MTKLNAIQQALSALDGGAYQKLADIYLRARGLGPINPIGSVAGADKVRTGTPDSFAATNAGSFIFAEHTTQREGLLAKLEGDVRKCLDPGKTGIPTERIERIILCFTGELQASHELTLRQMCASTQIQLELIGLQTLSQELYLHYPHLASDFLAVTVDTGQIVAPDRFVELHSHNNFAPPLDTTFMLREKEVQSALSSLAESPLAVLSGRAGDGKTRLALEVCRLFTQQNPDYTHLCVFGRSADLHSDLKTYLSAPGKYLLLVDDANRISRFDYVIDHLLHQTPEGSIKVIATVRDYALPHIRHAASQVSGCRFLEITRLNREDLLKIVRGVTQLQDEYLLDRVAQVAEGNARLALMASRVAIEEGPRGIQDATTLYDSYFESIRNDLSTQGNSLTDTSRLVVGAAIALFKAVDKSHTPMMQLIEQAFGVTPDRFWETARQLHDMELVDLHEHDVVRMSDQVLSTYMFYLAVFRENAVDLGMLLRNCFPDHRERLRDSILPVLSTFDTQGLLRTLKPHVATTWKELASRPEAHEAALFAESFWYAAPTEVLSWAQQQVERQTPTDTEPPEGLLQKSADTAKSGSIASVLSRFCGASNADAKIAVDVLVRHAATDPGQCQRVIRILAEEYGYRSDSHLFEYSIQHAVIETLASHLNTGTTTAGRLLLAVCRYLLETRIHSVFMVDKMTARMQQFSLVESPPLRALRNSIWKGILAIHAAPEHMREIRELLEAYVNADHRGESREVIASDSDTLMPLVSGLLDPNSYNDCVLAHKCLDLAESHGVQVADDLRGQFENETTDLARDLLSDRDERRLLELDYEDYEKHKLEHVKRIANDMTLAKLGGFVDQCLVIKGRNPNGNTWAINNRFAQVLEAASKEKPQRGLQLLSGYLGLGDPMKIHGYQIVSALVGTLGHDAVAEMIRDHDCWSRDAWLFDSYECIPAEHLEAKHVRELLALYEKAQPQHIPRSWQHLHCYRTIDEDVFCSVASTLLSRQHEDEAGIGFAFQGLFLGSDADTPPLSALFAKQPNTLAQAYLLAESDRQHTDYNGKVFSTLLDFNKGFLKQYSEWKRGHSDENGGRYSSDDRDYSFLWRRDDWTEVLDETFGPHIANSEQTDFYAHQLWEKVFDDKTRKSKDSDDTRHRQVSYLKDTIAAHATNRSSMQFVFNAVSTLAPEDRSQLVACFVEANPTLEDFKRLNVEPMSWGWQGSKVPLLHRRVDFWTSLLSTMNTPALLQHKAHITSQIDRLQDEIELHKKADFMSDFGRY